MCDNWIEKYKPKKIKDIIGNSNSILKINHWLSNFKNEKYCSVVISGYHGVGKNLITKILLESNNYYYKWLDYKDEKAKNLFDDLINSFTEYWLIQCLCQMAVFTKEDKTYSS